MKAQKSEEIESIHPEATGQIGNSALSGNEAEEHEPAILKTGSDCARATFLISAMISPDVERDVTA